MTKWPSIFFHNYYGQDEQWTAFFRDNIPGEYKLFYNGVNDSYYREKEKKENGEVEKNIRAVNQLIETSSPNIGKDIGGKLVLMDAYLRRQEQSDYILLMHDKRSPYQSNGATWKEKLLAIAKKENTEKVQRLFREDAQVGIVAAASTIVTDQDNAGRRYKDTSLMQRLLKEYEIKPLNWQFVAGTMFWVRASIFQQFFSKYPPLAIRATLEKGNIMDHESPTITHAWERLLCWLVTASHYTIKGI